MLHLAQKAFYPAGRRSRCCTSTRPGSSARCTSSATRWRDEMRHGAARASSTRRRMAQGINPFDHGSAIHTDIEDRGPEAGAGQVRLRRRLRRRPARRGEVAGQGADLLVPHRAAPLGPEEPAARALAACTTPASSKGESIRVFPLSNWTELDVWQYIHLEKIPIVPLYFAAGAPGGRARRHADHGRRRPHAAAAGRGADAEAGALPHARLLPADRRGRVRRPTRCRRSSRRCC